MEKGFPVRPATVGGLQALTCVYVSPGGRESPQNPHGFCDLLTALASSFHLDFGSLTLASSML